MDEQKIKVYVRTSSNGLVTKIFSSIFETPLDTDVLIDTSTETSDRDKFAHADIQYLSKSLIDLNQCYNYKIVDGELTERTDEEKQADSSYVEKVRQNKLNEISTACETTIYSGTDAITTKGTEHFSATAADQTNLSALAAAIVQGAMQVPYHADGQLCREFTAAEFTTIFTTVKNFIAYNTTLCNHINVWIRRCTTADEISAITYASKLPEDLQTNFNAIMGITS